MIYASRSNLLSYQLGLHRLISVHCQSINRDLSALPINRSGFQCVVNQSIVISVQCQSINHTQVFKRPRHRLTAGAAAVSELNDRTMQTGTLGSVKLCDCARIILHIGIIVAQSRDFQFFFYSTADVFYICLLYTSPSPRDRTRSRMPSSA